MTKLKQIIVSILCVSLVATNIHPIFAIENYTPNNETTYEQNNNDNTTKEAFETSKNENETAKETIKEVKETEKEEIIEKDENASISTNETSNINGNKLTNEEIETNTSSEEIKIKESTKYEEELENEIESTTGECLELETLEEEVLEEINLEEIESELNESTTQTETQSQKLEYDSEIANEETLSKNETAILIATDSIIEYSEELMGVETPIVTVYTCMAATMSFVDYLELTTVEQFNANEKDSAAQEGNTIKLEKDIQLVYPIYVNEELNINMNNHKIYASNEYSAFNVTKNVKFYDELDESESLIQGSNVRTVYVKNANVVVDTVKIYGGKGNDKNETVGSAGPDAFYLDYDSNDYTFTFKYGEIIGGTGGSGVGDTKGNFGAPIKIGEYDISNEFMVYGIYGEEGGGDGGNAIYCTYKDMDIKNFIIEIEGICGGDGGKNINSKANFYKASVFKSTNNTYPDKFISDKNPKWGGRKIVTSLKDQDSTSLCCTYGTTATVETNLLVSTPGFIKSLGYSDGSDDGKKEFNLSEFHLAYYLRQPQEDERGNAKKYMLHTQDPFFKVGAWGRMIMNHFVNHKAQAEEKYYPSPKGLNNITYQEEYIDLANSIENSDPNKNKVFFYVEKAYNTTTGGYSNFEDFKNDIKKLVYEYGACQFVINVSYLINKKKYSWNTHGPIYGAEFEKMTYVYKPKWLKSIPNSGCHAMCCIGWDDDYFYGDTENEGAFFVKNSWNDTVYAISYDFVACQKPGIFETTAYILQPNEEKLKNLNYYDSNPDDYNFTYDKGTKLAHVYKAQDEKEKIYKLGFTIGCCTNAKFRVYLLGTNPHNMKKVNSSDCVWESYECELDNGYNSIDIPEGIEVEKNDYYAVEIELLDNTNNTKIRVPSYIGGGGLDDGKKRYCFLKKPNESYKWISDAYRIKAITNSGYKVEFNCDGGEVIISEDDDQITTSDSFDTAIYYAEPFGNTSTKVPEKEGYVFEGWTYSDTKIGAYKDIDASTILYPTKDKQYFFKAKWNVNLATYSVTLDAKGGKMNCYDPKTKTIIQGVSIATYSYTNGTPFGERDIPKKDNAIFKGWFTTYKNRTTPIEVYADTILKMDDNNMIIYAEYYDNNPYYLKFTADESTGGKYLGGSETISTKSAAKVVLTPYTNKLIPNEGYTFDYWERDNGVRYAGEESFNDISIKAGQTVTLKAKFKEKTNSLPPDWYLGEDIDAVKEIEIISSPTYRAKGTKHEINSSKLKYYTIPLDNVYEKIQIVSTDAKGAKIPLEDSSEDSGAFMGFINLESIKGLDKLDTSKTTNMSFLFQGCSNLKNLDLSTFNTSFLTNATGMFEDCKNIEKLDLSTWYTQKITNTERMFASCTKLTTITLSEDMNVEGIKYSQGMFDDCPNLVGGCGTRWRAYDEDTGMPITDKTYAWCDDLTSNPSVAGYFTKKLSIYSINYNLNGGTIKGKPVYSYTTKDKDISLSNIVALKSGYKFIGWTDENGNAITVIETKLAKDRTISARWRLIGGGNGGSSSGGGSGSISAGSIIAGQIFSTAAPKEQVVLTVRPRDDKIPVANIESTIWITDPITGNYKMTFVNSLGKVEQCANGFYNLVKTEYVIDPLTNIPIPKVIKASYYFDATGDMQTGWVTTLDGKKYFFDNAKTANEGNMSIGWKQVQGSWYYFDSDGSMMRSGVTKDGQRIGADGKWVEPNATNTQM